MRAFLFFAENWPGNSSLSAQSMDTDSPDSTSLPPPPPTPLLTSLRGRVLRLAACVIISTATLLPYTSALPAPYSTPTTRAPHLQQPHLLAPQHDRQHAPLCAGARWVVCEKSPIACKRSPVVYEKSPVLCKKSPVLWKEPYSLRKRAPFHTFTRRLR